MICEIYHLRDNSSQPTKGISIRYYELNTKDQIYKNKINNIWNHPTVDIFYQKVAVIEIKDVIDVEDALEYAFTLTDTIDIQWTRNRDVEMCIPSKTVRSTKVGDIFVIDNVRYLVDTIGFSKL